MRKISLMLEAVELPHTVKHIDSYDSNNVDADFLKASPNKTLPAIFDTDNDVALFESGAILFYLAEKSKKLIPQNLAAKADVVKWLMFEVSNICPTMIELHYYYLNDTGETADTIFQRYKDMLVHYCSILNDQLETNEFLGGEFSIADIAIYPWTVTFEDMAEINLSDYPKLNNWVKLIDERLLNNR